MATKQRYRSGVADGALAIGHEFDTHTSLVTSGAKLVSVKNAGVETLSLSIDGKIENPLATNKLTLTSATSVATNEAFVFNSTADYSAGGNWMVWKNQGVSFADIRPSLFSHTGSGNSSFGGKLTANANNVSAVGLQMFGNIVLDTNGASIAQGGAAFSMIDTALASPLEHHINFNDRVVLRIQGMLDGSSNRQFPRIRTLMAPTINNAAFQIWDENNHTTSGNKLLQLLHNNGAKIAFDVDVDGTLRGQDLANGGGTNNPFKFLTREQDNATAVGYLLNSATLSNGGSIYMSMRNNSSEIVRVKFNGYTWLGGTPGGYTPDATAGLVVNANLVQLGSGSSQVGLDLKGGSAGAYISDASVFWQYFLKSPSRVEWPTKHVFQNNVGIIETSQANGSAGAGSPGFKISTVNTLSTSGDRLLSLTNVASEKFYIEYDGTVYAGANNNSAIFRSREDDGVTAVGTIIDTVNSLITSGSKLLSIKNAGQEILTYGVGVNGYTFFSNALGNPSVAAFVVDAKNNLTSAPDTSILEFRHVAALQSSIDPYGNYISEDGFNLYSKGTDSDPGFASGVVTIINNTFDTGDTVNIVIQGRGTFGFTETTDFTVGGSATITATNLASAINNRAILNTLVSAAAVGPAVTITTRFPGSLGNKIHLYELDGATDNFTLSGLSANNRFTGGTDNGFGLISDTYNVLTNDPQRRLLSLRNAQLEKVHFSPAGGIGVGSKGVAVSSSSTGETLIGVTSTAAPRTITLDLDDEVEGRVVIVKDESGGATTNNITVDTEGSSTIDGASSVTITADYGVVRLYFRNGNWFSF